MPKAAFDWKPLALVPCSRCCAAVDRLAVDLAHAHRRRPGDGHDHLHHRLGPDAGVRPDGRAELRPRRVHRARRLRRHQRDGRHGRLDAGDPAAGATWWRCSPRCWSRCWWPAPSAWPSSACIVRPVYGQHLKQILITMGGMIIGEELIKVIWGPAQIPLPLPEALRGSFLLGDAAVEKYRVLAVVDRPAGVRRAALDAEPHQDRPADPRRRAGPRDGRVARLPHPPPVRRRVRRRQRAGRPGRRDVGPVPAERDPADRRAGQRADLHRASSSAAWAPRSAASSARCWSG